MQFLNDGLYRPDSMYAAAPDLVRSAINGCGSATAKFDFVPDNLLGLKILPACQIHDWEYYIGETIEAKQSADRAFLNNMLRLINMEYKRRVNEINTHSPSVVRGALLAKEKVLRLGRRRLAWRYYQAVDRFGGPAFWEGKANGPQTIPV